MGFRVGLVGMRASGSRTTVWGVDGDRSFFVEYGSFDEAFTWALHGIA